MSMPKFQTKLWIGILIMALLSPLGVYLPDKLKAAGAWGEWGPEELEKLLGYVPEGLKKLSDFWKAPVPDYNFGGENAAMSTQVVSYVISGLLGIAAAGIVIFLITKFLIKREN